MLSGTVNRPPLRTCVCVLFKSPKFLHVRYLSTIFYECWSFWSKKIYYLKVRHHKGPLAHDAGPGRDVGAPDAARCERPGHDFAEGLPGSGVKPLAGIVFCASGTNLYRQEVFIADRLLLSVVLSCFRRDFDRPLLFPRRIQRRCGLYIQKLDRQRRAPDRSKADIFLCTCWSPFKVRWFHFRGIRKLINLHHLDCRIAGRSINPDEVYLVIFLFGHWW